MEALAAIGLAGNIITFVEFSGNLISNSIKLYQSGDGSVDDLDVESAAARLMHLSRNLKDEDKIKNSGDTILHDLCRSCEDVATELLAVLNDIKVDGKHQAWKSVRNALMSAWSKEKISALERRLARLREQLNLHLTKDLRKQLSDFAEEESDRFQSLDLTTQKILDAVTNQRDVFDAMQDLRLSTQTVLQEQVRSRSLAEQRRWDQTVAKLPNVPEAAFNSYARQDDPLCFAGTRKDLLEQIETWEEGEDNRNVFWLNGMAGTGKSTIARTVARKSSEGGRLGASFFFSKGGGDAGRAQKLFTSIAVQLASRLPSLRSSICDAVDCDSNVSNQSLSDQWKQLIVKPLMNAEGHTSQPPPLLVIDALDECEGKNDIKTVVQLLKETQSLEHLRIRILLTSRCEESIRYGFNQGPNSSHHDCVLHNIPQPIVNDDIFRYLSYSLEEVRRERSFAPGWPGDQALRDLVQNSSGLFIWAATACRYVRAGKRFAGKRLSKILEARSSLTEPEKRLDEIYITVLHSSIGHDYDEEERDDCVEMLRKVLGTIAILFLPLPKDSIARLLGLPHQVLNQALDDLHAILVIPAQQEDSIRLHHPTFRDFILNIERSGNAQFWVDQRLMHKRLTTDCMRIMCSTLKEDMCQLCHPGCLAFSIDKGRVAESLLPEVQYACLYWVQHAQQSHLQLCDDDEIHQFLLQHLLHWIEALSLMGKIAEGIVAIMHLMSLSQRSECPRLQAFVRDVQKFVSYARPQIEQAPLQVYCSLAFAPETSIVKKTLTRLPPWFRITTQTEEEWGPLMHVLQGHVYNVNRIVFSKDGKQVATGSRDENIRLWDSATGACLQVFEAYHSDPSSLKDEYQLDITAMTFTPDGNLAFVSPDFDLRLWNLATGLIMQVHDLGEKSIDCVALSPTKEQVAFICGSFIKIWSQHTGVRILEADREPATTLAFTPNGEKLVSASNSELCVWDEASSRLLNHLDYDLDDSFMVIALSSMGTIAFSGRDGCIMLCNQEFCNWMSLQRPTDSPTDEVVALVFSECGRRLASDHYSCTMIWNAITGEPLRRLETKGVGCALALSPNGDVLASCGPEYAISLWDLSLEYWHPTTTADGAELRALKFSMDGEQLATVSENHAILLWDAATGTLVRTLKEHRQSVTALAFSENGKQLASTSSDSTTILWDLATGMSHGALEEQIAPFYIISFAPDGLLLASYCHREKLQVWNVPTRTLRWQVDCPGRYWRWFKFASNGEYFVVVDSQLNLWWWNAFTGDLMRREALAHKFLRGELTISPCGTYVASSDYNDDIMLVDIVTGGTLQTFHGAQNRGHPNISTDRHLRFSTNGQHLDTGEVRLGITSLYPGASPRERSPIFRVEMSLTRVCQGDEPVLWLPHGQRLVTAAVQGNVVALAYESGRVTILEFNPTELNLRLPDSSLPPPPGDDRPILSASEVFALYHSQRGAP